MEQMRTFEGWAIVELFGHTTESGYVQTLYFGSSPMFQVDSPEIPKEESVTQTWEWSGPDRVPPGSRVEYSSIPAKQRIIGVSAIYAINPCSEEDARKHISEKGRSFTVLELGNTEQQEAIPF